MKFSTILFCLILLFTGTELKAQYFNTGQDPGNLKWMQIKTDRFRIIYPSSYGNAGIDFAKSLDEAWSKLSGLYPARKQRIPVIIHNYTTESNGYVAWAPRRMEIYPTPEQNSIPLDPNTQLAIHELTHVLQMESLNRGFTRIASIAAGEQFPGIVSSLLPLWYLEGDAVFSETSLTASGRGRSASFQKQLKSLLVEKGNVYSYDKSVNGSFRDFVPDHYQYGYQMMAYSYLKYGRPLWQDALKATGNTPFLINPVNLSLRKNASLSKKRLFTEAFDTLKTLWKSDDSVSDASSYEVINPPKGKQFINYHSPVLIGYDSIAAIRTSLSEPPSIVLIRPSEKKEKRIHIPGDCYPWFISYGKGKLCWIETHSDPRWDNRQWTVIKVMDIKSRKVRQLSFKTRYMAASISPDGNYIAAAENTPENSNRLVIIDAWNGDLLESVPSPANEGLQRPQWSDNGEKISVIYLTDEGEGIMAYIPGEKRWQYLVDPAFDDLQGSFLRNDSLFFVSSQSGTDNAYLRDPGGAVAPLTRSRFGISDINITGDLLLFCDYTSSGNNICIHMVPPVLEKILPPGQKASYLISRANPESAINVSGHQASYEPERYRKWQHLFRFHSWMPFYADIEKIQEDPASIRPGFTVMTQNNLSTLISSFGYEYSDNRHKLHSGIKWMGWYLVFESRLDYGDYPYIEKFGADVNNPPNLVNGIKMTNTVSLPLIFRGGQFTKYLYLSASSSYSNDNLYLRNSQAYDRGQNQLTGRLYFSNYRRSAIRDIYPGWAQVFDISYSYYPSDREIFGDILSAKASFYFPGILKNNNFRIRLDAEKQHPELFILNSRVSFSRSYTNVISPDLRFISADYFMPLLYPDLNLPGLIYITRIRSDFFYDYTRANTYYMISETESGRRSDFFDLTGTFKSYGIGLLSDFYLFRIPFMVSAGVQATWQKIGYMPKLEMLLSVDLFGMSIGKRKK
jgi:hypothetical protein